MKSPFETDVAEDSNFVPSVGPATMRLARTRMPSNRSSCSVPAPAGVSPGVSWIGAGNV